ncbi:hypothetical protein ANCDUO_23495 [Ancylostoma duodenale]|uniref:Cysteine rich repeat-containing domain protein n=1 Tax=Ancylostoma duodenale TaxID=51022 RepID=A0A0C2BRM1_9BILA|nr:hypothetical protein ANCDUO_23495 [Ancylostoma duodenale]
MHLQIPVQCSPQCAPACEPQCVQQYPMEPILAPIQQIQCPSTCQPACEETCILAQIKLFVVIVRMVAINSDVWQNYDICTSETKKRRARVKKGWWRSCTTERGRGKPRESARFAFTNAEKPLNRHELLQRLVLNNVQGQQSLITIPLSAEPTGQCASACQPACNTQCTQDYQFEIVLPRNDDCMIPCSQSCLQSCEQQNPQTLQCQNACLDTCTTSCTENPMSCPSCPQPLRMEIILEEPMEETVTCAYTCAEQCTEQCSTRANPKQCQPACQVACEKACPLQEQNVCSSERKSLDPLKGALMKARDERNDFAHSQKILEEIRRLSNRAPQLVAHATAAAVSTAVEQISAVDDDEDVK